MAFVNAQKSRVLLGALHLSGYTRQISGFGFNVDMLKTTTLLDTAEAFIPGNDSSTASIDQLLDVDSTAGLQWDVLTGWKSASPQPLTFGPSGIAVAAEVFMVAALQSSISGATSVGDAVSIKTDAQIDGPSDVGVVIETLAAATVDANGTARDNGAASANGGVAHLHVTDFSGITSDAITIEHSVNGSTSWAVLVTFATVTAKTSERVVVAAGTTVRQFLRVVDDITGTGSATRMVTFARR